MKRRDSTWKMIFGRALCQCVVVARGKRRLMGESLESRICLSAVRIVSWNTANGPDNGAEDAFFSTVFEAIGKETVAGNSLRPSIVALQETDNLQAGGNSIARIEAILESLYPQTSYDRAVTTLDSGDDATGFVFDTGIFQLVTTSVVAPLQGMRAFAHHVMRAQFRPNGTEGGSDFYLYSTHLKAGSNGTDAARRTSEAAAIRADVDALGAGQDVLVMGDFNISGSFEGAYQNFLAAGPGQLLDPIDQPGQWKNNPAFVGIHTQNPEINGPGGMDDRYDFQLASAAVFDDRGLQFIEGSYRAVGNNGTHTFNSDITTGTGASPAVLAALAAASDHLPVVADYEVDVDNDNDAPNVVISEIMYNSASDEPAGEWVEIVNLGPDNADIQGWFLDDEDASDWSAIPEGTAPLGPGDVAIVHNREIDSVVFRDRWSVPLQTSVIGVQWGSLANSPSAGSEILVLRDAGGGRQDLVNYDDDGVVWPNDNNRSSIYLPDPRVDNNLGTNWALSSLGTDGATSPSGSPFSDRDIGSPGFVPGVDLTPPVVTGIRLDANQPDDRQRSMLRKVTVVFDQIIAASASAFTLQKRGHGETPETNVSIDLALSESSGRSEAELTFRGDDVDATSGSLVDGNYLLTIIAAEVTRATSGVALDGDGDGVAGGNLLFGADASDAFFRLFGDSDGDRDVDGQDYGRFGLAFLKTSGQDGYDDAFDHDVDGDIDGQDYGRFGQKFLTALPF